MFGYFGIDGVLVKFLIVGCEMFDGSNDFFVLYCFYKGDYYFGC